MCLRLSCYTAVTTTVLTITALIFTSVTMVTHPHLHLKRFHWGLARSLAFEGNTGI